MLNLKKHVPTWEVDMITLKMRIPTWEVDMITLKMRIPTWEVDMITLKMRIPTWDVVFYLDVAADPHETALRAVPCESVAKIN
jgi:hypothetical protein